MKRSVNFYVATPVQTVQEQLHASGLRHLGVRRRGAVLTIESGPPTDPFPRARLRRVAVHLWQLEMPTRSGRWDATPFRAQLDDLVTSLMSDFGWTLQDFGDTISDPDY